MNMRRRQQEMTRRAILEAVGEEVAESGTLGFSVQAVANRAGVTHRTVYNHFPTREALQDAFAVHVEDVLRDKSQLTAAPDDDLTLARLVEMVPESFALFARFESEIRAYATLTLASRHPAKVATDRSLRFAKLLEDQARLPPDDARLVAAAIRMFMSSIGFHVLTEHLRLSTSEASAVTSWVTKTLLAAAQAGDLPKLEMNDDSGVDS